MMLREELVAIFEAGVAAAGAPATLPRLLPRTPPLSGRTIVLGCGKAAAAMAEVAADGLPGRLEGCVVTRFGHGARRSTGAIAVIEARHPVPDAASLAAGRRIREQAATARKGDRVVFLISGGGSSLLVDPLPGLTLETKASINSHLVHAGVPIADINCVRRHLSQVKGGRLAAAAAAAAGDMHSFVISDVVGDDPAVVASGPSVASPFEPERAIAILSDSGWRVGDTLAAMIRAAAPPPSPVHPVEVIADARTALDAASTYARKRGWRVVRIGDDLAGDAAATGRAHAALALAHAGAGTPCLLVSGGELTVSVKAQDGRGGPNLEYLAGLMAALPEGAPVAALACDSDGIDGSGDNAGGWFDGARRAPMADCEAALAANRSYDLFARLGGLVMTGPTRTNVNDIRLIAVGAPAQPRATVSSSSAVTG
jgi:hydroxypyruvate reductase